MITTFEYEPIYQFDQAGLCVRIDENNWIKFGSEYPNVGGLPKLSTVVTNFGYSDWSMQDCHKSKHMGFRLTRVRNDYNVDYLSPDTGAWTQMRLTHLHHESRVVKAGLYCCSPIEKGFAVNFKELIIKELIR